jgi:general secretion pathway protein M
MNATVASLPTGPRGQAIAVALLVLVLLLLWTALVSPLLGFYSDRADELATQQLKAAHMAVLAEQVPDLKKRAESSGHTGPAPSLVVEGPSDAVAAATLQGKVQSMATEVGTTLTSVENLPHEPVGTAYHRIGLKISLNASWPVLIALLKAVDQATPPMLLDDVQIHGSPLPMVNVNRGLEANFTIWALRAGPVGDRKP